MDMTGEYRIPAPREKVWAALNDPEILRQSIPGCEEIEKLSPTEMTAKVTAKVGPVKARFGGKVTLSDLDPPNGYRISGEGQGGAAGFARGGAEVKLEPDGEATILRYTVNANVGGKLAQIGSRLIDATARKMAEDFFGRFAEIVGGGAAAAAPADAGDGDGDGAPAPTAAAAPQAVPPPRPPAAAAPARPAVNPTIWIVGLIALAVLILLVFATPR
ncbi:MAG: carbon monoxide dehydrogenase subunit G [Alphaproteobacteria bacterium]